MDHDSLLRNELFDWYTSLIPTAVESHQVRASDFASADRELFRPVPRSPISPKKLVLVLDLDLTLVHAMQRSSFVESFEPSLLGGVDFGCADDNPQIFCLWLDSDHYVLKLRPGVRHFLRELSQIYELSIFTKGSRPYLNFILAVLDPHKKLFATAVSRDDAPQLDNDTKLLSVVTQRPLTEVIVFDDRQSVWRECPHNVIRAEPYIFLEKKSSSLAVTVNCATRVCMDNDRHLESITSVLKKVYSEYCKMPLGRADAREAINCVRMQTLSGCKIMFSGVPKDELPEYTSLVTTFGGKVEEGDLPNDGEGEPQITHLVVGQGGKHNTKKVYDARRFGGKVKVLHGSWLALAVSTWTIPDEPSFDLARFAYDVEGRTATDIDPWDHLSQQ